MQSTSGFLTASSLGQSYAHLPPTLEERATSFFIANYVVGPGGPTNGHLNALKTTYEYDDNLMASMKAVGLAGFANVENSLEVMEQARMEYCKALRLTNIALQLSETARKNSTLLSIKVLSMYETVTGSSQKSLEVWADHIRGASALIKLRGSEQLEMPEGRRLVIHVTSYILITCMQREMSYQSTSSNFGVLFQPLSTRSSQPGWLKIS